MAAPGQPPPSPPSAPVLVPPAPFIDVGADLPLDNSVGLLADGEDTVEAVVVVDHLLHRQGDRGHLLGKGGNAHLGVD